MADKSLKGKSVEKLCVNVFFNTTPYETCQKFLCYINFTLSVYITFKLSEFEKFNFQLKAISNYILPFTFSH